MSLTLCYAYRQQRVVHAHEAALHTHVAQVELELQSIKQEMAATLKVRVRLADQSCSYLLVAAAASCRKSQSLIL